MTTYRVTIKEEVRYTIEVDASTQGEAEDIAMETMVQCEDPNQFLTSVEEREVFYVDVKA